MIAMPSDPEYFCRRAREEREAADRSGNQNVRLRHLEFAQAYEFWFREMKADRQSAGQLVAVGSFDAVLDTIRDQAGPAFFEPTG